MGARGRQGEMIYQELSRGRMRTRIRPGTRKSVVDQFDVKDEGAYRASRAQDAEHIEDETGQGDVEDDLTRILSATPASP